jgi:hypothetical protein
MADWGSNLIPFAKLSLVVDGGSTGLLTVPSTFNLRIGAVCYLSATGLETKTLQIADIVSDTQLYVKLTDPLNYTRFNASAYTVLLSASLTQPEQTNFYIYKEPGIADVFRALRDLRDSTGIKQGAPNTVANAWPVKITDGTNVLGTNTNPIVVSTGGSTATVVTEVASSITNVTLKAANTLRTGLTIFNASTAILYVKLGATATSADYTLQMAPSSYYEVPSGYSGRIDGIWVAANGFAYVTEISKV